MSGAARASLRRKPRVRYDTLGGFEGVDLGDDEELRRLRPMSSSEDEGGFNSGDGNASSARKGKGRAPAGRGTSAGRSREASESEFELDEDADDAGHDDELDLDVVDEESGCEGRDHEYDDEDVLDFSQDAGKKTSKKKRPPTASSGPPPGLGGAEYGSDEDAFLAAQFSKRNKLATGGKKGGAVTPNITQFGGAIAKAFKQGTWQVLVENTLPLHPTGQSYLLSPPDLGKFSNVLVVDTEENPRGQGLSEAQRTTMLHGHWTKVPLETPWSWWAGQAWWPDCYQDREIVRDNTGAEQRKRRRIDWKKEHPKDHWKQKVEVKLDLGDVGRYNVGDIKHKTIACASCFTRFPGVADWLIRRQARDYLPLREHNPEPTLIIGLRTEEDEGADIDPPEAYKFQALQAMQFRKFECACAMYVYLADVAVLQEGAV